VKPFLALALCAAGAALLFGNGVSGAVVDCVAVQPAAGHEGPALVGDVYDMQHLPIPLDAVLFADANLSAHVAVQRLFAARTPSDAVEVTARFVNCTDSRMVLRVRVSFLGARQAPTEAPSAWQQVHLPPRGMAIYTERSMATDTVTNFVMELRDGSHEQ